MSMSGRTSFFSWKSIYLLWLRGAYIVMKHDKIPGLILTFRIASDAKLA